MRPVPVDLAIVAAALPGIVLRNLRLWLLLDADLLGGSGTRLLSRLARRFAGLLLGGALLFGSLPRLLLSLAVLLNNLFGLITGLALLLEPLLRCLPRLLLSLAGLLTLGCTRTGLGADLFLPLLPGLGLSLKLTALLDLCIG
jgi:hypothetical protein